MGSAHGIFITGAIILLFFNLFYISMYPQTAWSLTMGTVTGFIATILAVGVISGFNLLGSGLTGASVKILFGGASLLNILFQINIAGFPVGMGLANNLLGSFTTSSFLEGLGFFLSLILTLIIFISGIIIIIGSGD